MEKIAVLIPCYNEELTIEKVIKDFRKELPNADIYVYNNNSKDKTAEIAKDNGAIVINEYKQGKGNVVRSQFRDIDADIYVMVDGDDTYPAEFVHKLIEPVRNGQADMAIGDRLSNGTYQKENKRPFHEFGNNLVRKAINVLFNTDLKDIMTGYRVFNKRFVKNMPVLSPKFEIETEMSLYALDKRYIIKEIPIVYRDRPEGSSSKLNTVSDGIKVVKTIIRMFKDYKPFRFFGIIALIFLILGLIVGIPVLVEFFKTSYITKVPSAILATGFVSLAAITFQCGIILDTITRQHRENYELQLLRYEQIERLVTVIADNYKTTNPYLIQRPLIIGPSGVGKTETLKLIAEYLKIPFTRYSTPTLSGTGYRGKDIESILRMVYQNAGKKIKACNESLIFLDEIDKIAERGRDVSDEAVQNLLLNFLDGTVYDVEIDQGITVNIDTTLMNIVFGGAFEDMLNDEEFINEYKGNVKENAYKEGYDEGFDDGCWAEKVIISRRLLNKDFDYGFIGDITNLSIEEVKRIESELN